MTGARSEGIATWFDGAQKGDPVAVEGLLRSVLPTAQRFAAHSCANREDAEDAAQEALTALVRRVGALRAAEMVASWLFVTIRRACLHRFNEVVPLRIDTASELPVAHRADAVVNRVVVAEALARLPANHREVLVLIDLLGLPAARAAAHLGIGVRAAKTRLHRARRALAATLEGERTAA